MTTTAVGRLARSRGRGMFLAIAALLVVALATPAVAATTVNLHSPHVGANSMTFNNEPSGNGGLTDPVVWHFVLNQLDPQTEPGTIYVTFNSGLTRTATGRPVGIARTQHFYVGTPGHDVIASAYALVESSDGMLVLSHVAWSEPPGEEPPGEEPPGEEPPGEEPPGEEPPGDGDEDVLGPIDDEDEIVPGDDDEVVVIDDEDEDFLPFTEEDEVEATIAVVEDEDYLPFTGIETLLLLGAGASAAGGGVGLRKFAKARGV